MTLLNLPFQEKDVFERKHSFLHICHEMFLFCLCPVRSSLDSVLRPFFGVQNASFCVQKASLSVRAGRVRMKIHSAPFFESSSLKTRVSSKNAKILDQKQKRIKKRSLETQGTDINLPAVALENSSTLSKGGELVTRHGRCTKIRIGASDWMPILSQVDQRGTCHYKSSGSMAHSPKGRWVDLKCYPSTSRAHLGDVGSFTLWRC